MALPIHIPELPAFGKENVRGVLNQRKEAALPLTKKSISRNNSFDIQNHQGITAPIGMKKYRSEGNSQVLKDDELVEDFFCLNNDSTRDLRNLCDSIAFGAKSHCVKTWLQVLKASCETAENLPNPQSMDLIRLHKRALLILGNPKSKENHHGLVDIHMSLAKANVILESLDSAENEFRNIQSLGIGKDQASLYVEWSKLYQRKQDHVTAMQKIQDGLSSGAEPRILLIQEKALIESKHDSIEMGTSRQLVGVIPPLPGRLPSMESINKRKASCIKSENKVSISEPVVNSRRQASRVRNVSFVNDIGLKSTTQQSKLGAKSSSRRAPFNRKRNLGGAVRISRPDANSSIMSDASDDESHSVNSKNTDTGPTKLSQMDLAYMLNWDPEAFRQKKKADDVKKEEKKQRKLEGEKEKEKQKAVEIVPVKHEKKSNNETSDPKLHPDFVNVAKVDNVITVNDSAYAKLGVIGKGGSGKVYRALSKDCRVLAIKKVKLDGMDDRQIDLYSNEINLLKRLNGSPAIIQLYDSQVDLSRKALFVVMEVGEADLNYVLQQQAKALDGATGNHQNGSSLNLNFIRLTWQQMLSAVHCIHEERIIHGDLKPANFLFVRGALKLIDFGIAKAMQNNDTTNIYRDSQIGTLNYMSPEAILGTSDGEGGMRMKLGRASDIWSLGCILYQLLYGKTPFADLHMIQKLQAITNPSHQIAYPAGNLEAVDAIQKCLRRNPESRPPIIGKGGLLNEHCFLHGNK